ncbi:sensor histidine kinase [Cohnella nanjingensis]|uniref:histidine kinase n=1 Tax=Cohnella nanjingensis TaxID=1387779 RepID=A0A7X0VGM6_9BACL|nr:histidine kinase [Cohnella nanjingensis]MBB6672518.1 histidine kinase [Cohnella nanjingensis]
MKQFTLSLDNTLTNMNYVSQQLAFDGGVGRDLDQWLDEEDLYRKATLTERISMELNLISLTNPTIGLTFYCDRDAKSVVFPNPQVASGFNLRELPVLIKMNTITVYGPHPSLDRFNSNKVLSVVRKVDLPDRAGIYVYVETSFNYDQNLLEENKKVNRDHLILDKEGVVTYSDRGDAFPVGSRLEVGRTGQPREMKGFYLFEEPTSQGWRAVNVIPRSEYNAEIDRWLWQILAIFLFSLLLGIVLARQIWRMVYRPLNKINNEIQRVEKSDFHSPVMPTSIVEFDRLLRHLERMRSRIEDLLVEVERKEKRRADFEVEKLLYQINPHFIHNTLDTIRWLARLKGNDEIDEIASSLNKLLYYNLGKKSHRSTVAEEIEALKDYLTLQKIRYDFEFLVDISVSDDILSCEIPRFVLQPLVENSLYHGHLAKDGRIEVRIEPAGDSRFTIAVKDNGKGISQQELKKLMGEHKEEDKRIGLGIGTYYVKKAIESHFGDEAEFRIESDPNRGTTVSLRLPRRFTGGGHD